nr:signal peptidase I [Aequitasia blattaphilus]
MACSGIIVLSATGRMEEIRLGGKSMSVVLTNSMSPEIEAGSLIFLTEKPGAEIVEGDIINYETGGIRLTHRVVEVYESDNSRYYITQGDANQDKDVKPVQDTQIKGVVTASVPNLGRIAIMMKQPSFILSLFSLLLAVNLFFKALTIDRIEEQDKEITI